MLFALVVVAVEGSELPFGNELSDFQDRAWRGGKTGVPSQPGRMPPGRGSVLACSLACSLAGAAVVALMGPVAADVALR